MYSRQFRVTARRKTFRFIVIPDAAPCSSLFIKPYSPLIGMLKRVQHDGFFIHGISPILWFGGLVVIIASSRSVLIRDLAVMKQQIPDYHLPK